jgi:ribosomal protein L34
MALNIPPRRNRRKMKQFGFRARKKGWKGKLPAILKRRMEKGRYEIAKKLKKWV